MKGKIMGLMAEVRVVAVLEVLAEVGCVVEGVVVDGCRRCGCLMAMRCLKLVWHVVAGCGVRRVVRGASPSRTAALALAPLLAAAAALGATRRPRTEQGW